MQKRGQAVKDVIIEAASRTFRDVGYKSASVDSIAKTAGVSKATLYAHFSSKEGLFKAIVSDFVKPFLEVMPPPEPVPDVREALVRFADTIFSVLITPEKLEWDRMMVATAKQFPNLAQEYFRAGPQRALSQLADFLKSQEQAGVIEVPDPDFSAEMLCGMLFGTKILKRLIGNQPVHHDRPTMEKIIDAFLKVHTP
jgi:TetR/AcrR family transcriptional regulator, mexJK operon transcriptional repressor